VGQNEEIRKYVSVCMKYYEGINRVKYLIRRENVFMVVRRYEQPHRSQ
jgi:hypothetical protein